MQEGTLDLLRNNKLGGGDDEDQKTKTKTKTSRQEVKKAKSSASTSAYDARKDKHAKRPPPLDDGDESDGGFFEM